MELSNDQSQSQTSLLSSSFEHHERTAAASAAEDPVASLVVESSGSSNQETGYTIVETLSISVGSEARLNESTQLYSAPAAVNIESGDAELVFAAGEMIPTETAEDFDDLQVFARGVATLSVVEPDADLSHLKETEDDEYCLPMSLVAEQSEIKVEEMKTDLVEHEDEEDLMILKQQQKEPVYEASEDEVLNRKLKVVMVAAPGVDKSSLRRYKERRRKSTSRTLKLSAENWQLDTVTCRVFDVRHDGYPETPNCGAHSGTQALFFSPNSLYLLVWDLGVLNVELQSLRQSLAELDYESDFDDDHSSHDFEKEEHRKETDRALRVDIHNRVLSWFDCIAQRAPRSAILPVVLVAEHMSVNEVEHRRSVLQHMLEEHYKNNYDIHRNPDDPQLLLTGADNMIPKVNNFGAKEGIRQLQTWVKAMTNDETRSVFDHLGSPLPYGTVRLREAIRRLRNEHKLILLDHLLSELSDHADLDVKMVIECLHFLASIGEILYFGSNNGNDVLSQFVILSHTWLVSALSCVLRNDWGHELAKERRFMNTQRTGSNQPYDEHEVVQAFANSTCSCPLLSKADAQLLWQSQEIVREASEHSSHLIETSTSPPTIFDFLERLLEYSGVLLPLGTTHDAPSLQPSEVYFVPSLLAEADPHNLWTYKHAEAYLTTLCHSWLFRDGAPPKIMETITVNLLKDFFDFTRDFVDIRDEQALGRVRIHHFLCYTSTVVIKVGTVFSDSSSLSLKERYVEVFVAIIDQNSPHAVAADVMQPMMQRVVVSGKGPSGLNGRHLWKGGYETAVDSVRKTLCDLTNVDAQVVCPHCLARANPHSASTWGWDSVLAVARRGCPSVICLKKGHRANCALLSGIFNEERLIPITIHTGVVNIQEVLPSVVLVCVWNPDAKQVIGAGSGFVLDMELGLIVTAGHVMFNMDEGSNLFGVPYFGKPNAKALIGVIPEKGGSQAVFRYFADVVALDPHNVDACILQPRSRLENDIRVTDGFENNVLLESALAITDMSAEDLKSLKLAKNSLLEENVRLCGYNQGGEGLRKPGRHLSGSADIANGYICRHFKPGFRDDSFSSDSSTSYQTFAPREEIVAICSTIPGHSGGPFVNSEGKVVGILSRSDSVEKNRCYLVPATEIKLLKKEHQQTDSKCDLNRVGLFWGSQMNLGPLLLECWEERGRPSGQAPFEKVQTNFSVAALFALGLTKELPSIERAAIPLVNVFFMILPLTVVRTTIAV